MKPVSYLLNRPVYIFGFLLPVSSLLFVLKNPWIRKKIWRRWSQRWSICRASLPSHLSNTVISSHRSNFPNIDSGSDSLLFRTAATTDWEEPLVSRDGARLGGIEQESLDSFIQLKERVYENIATVPLVVERMREGKERIDKSNSFNGTTTIHPAFTRRKAN
ncbi:unnamed protein product [Arabidopsis halleri]